MMVTCNKNNVNNKKCEECEHTKHHEYNANCEKFCGTINAYPKCLSIKQIRKQKLDKIKRLKKIL